MLALTLNRAFENAFDRMRDLSIRIVVAVVIVWMAPVPVAAGRAARKPGAQPNPRPNGTRCGL